MALDGTNRPPIMDLPEPDLAIAGTSSQQSAIGADRQGIDQSKVVGKK